MLFISSLFFLLFHRISVPLFIFLSCSCMLSIFCIWVLSVLIIVTLILIWSCPNFCHSWLYIWWWPGLFRLYFVLFTMPHIFLLKARRGILVKVTKVDKPLVWNVVFIWLGIRLCFLFAVTIVSEAKILSRALFSLPYILVFLWAPRIGPESYRNFIYILSLPYRNPRMLRVWGKQPVLLRLSISSSVSLSWPFPSPHIPG